MAEQSGLVEQVLGGGESEAPKADSEAALDPVAAALAVHATRSGEPLDPRLRSYLEKQARLIEIQTEHLHEQRAILISHLKLRRSIDRLKFGMQLFIALAATLVGLGVVVMLFDAFTSHAVVVDAFKAPSALAGRGLTGEVTAEALLDALQKMQEATRSTEKGPNAHGAWASDIKIEVPETGVSVGEISRMLHERFGHDLHINGELIQTDRGGLTLTVRGDGVPAAGFTGDSGDLEKLTLLAAEYIYGRSQPYQYGVYLNNQGRFADTISFIHGAFPRLSSDTERSRLANTWGNAYVGLLQTAAAVEKYRLAMTFAKPRTADHWKAWGNLVGAATATDEEVGWRAAHAMLQAAAAAPKRERPDVRWLGNAALAAWDLPLLLASNLRDATFNGGAGASTFLDGPAIADAYGWTHDYSNASRYIAGSDPSDPTTKAEVFLLQGYVALDRGDVKGASAPFEAFYKTWAGDPSVKYSYNYQDCLTGLVYGLNGRLQEAEAVFQQARTQSFCYAAHGYVLARAGDVAAAERVWSEGMRAFPDLPAILLYRGQFEIGRGDLKAGEADVASASGKAPHWADPLKAWGDVLAREEHWREALAKYDEALKYAPAWVELRQARNAAAQHGG